MICFWQVDWHTADEMNALCIQTATHEDLPRLTELLAEPQESGVERLKRSEGIHFLLENPKLGQVFVVRKEGWVIAMISVLTSISTAEGGYVLLVEDLVVDKGHRNQGIGSLLLEHTVDYSRENGFLRLTLSSEQLTGAARDFFRRRGFVDSEMIPMRLQLVQSMLDSMA